MNDTWSGISQHRRDERGGQAERHDEHLLEIGPRDRLRPAGVVYETARPPMMTVVSQSGHPRITVSTTAGA